MGRVQSGEDKITLSPNCSSLHKNGRKGTLNCTDLCGIVNVSVKQVTSPAGGVTCLTETAGANHSQTQCLSANFMA